MVKPILAHDHLIPFVCSMIIWSKFKTHRTTDFGPDSTHVQISYDIMLLVISCYISWYSHSITMYSILEKWDSPQKKSNENPMCFPRFDEFLVVFLVHSLRIPHCFLPRKPQVTPDFHASEETGVGPSAVSIYFLSIYGVFLYVFLRL